MSDTVDAIEIGGTWTNLNIASGIESGTAIVVQNLGNADGAIEARGTPNAVIEITIKDSAPSHDFIGSYIERNHQWAVSAGALAVWVRFSRRSGAPIGSSLALVKVQVSDRATTSSTGLTSSSIDDSVDNNQQLYNSNVIEKLNSIIFLLEEIAGLSGLKRG